LIGLGTALRLYFASGRVLASLPILKTRDQLNIAVRITLQSLKILPQLAVFQELLLRGRIEKPTQPMRLARTHRPHFVIPKPCPWRAGRLAAILKEARSHD